MNIDKWIKENKIGSVLVLILLVTILYFSKQNLLVSSEDKTEISPVSNSLNVYRQMLPTLPKHDIYCIPEKKSFCSLEGCKAVKSEVFVLLGQNKDGFFIGRCDNKPCDIYPSDISESGVFLNFETKEPHGLLFKTSSLDHSFIEVATIGTDAFVSSGRCYSK